MKFPQYSLRTLFVVVTILAVPCGWLGWQAKIVRQRKAMMEMIMAADGAFPSPDDLKLMEPRAQYKPLPWYRLMLGDEEIQIIKLKDSIRDRADEVRESFPEADIFK